MPRWIEGTVVDNIHWTDTLYSVRVRADIQPFTAGQFARLGLHIGERRLGRPYSFVNSPHEDIHEFYSVIVPEGPLSPRLAQLQAGDSVLVGPRSAGFFTLSIVPDAPTLWMLSTGTALGPFLSMLKTDEPWQRFARMVFVHAVRHAEELTYQEQIHALLQRNPQQLQYIPFVSREATDFALPGRIPAAIESGALQRRAGLDMTPADSQIMICGNPAMVRDTQALLETLGFVRNTRKIDGHITTENYW